MAPQKNYNYECQKGSTEIKTDVMFWQIWYILTETDFVCVHWVILWLECDFPSIICICVTILLQNVRTWMSILYFTNMLSSGIVFSTYLYNFYCIKVSLEISSKHSFIWRHIWQFLLISPFGCLNHFMIWVPKGLIRNQNWHCIMTHLNLFNRNRLGLCTQCQIIRKM